MTDRLQAGTVVDGRYRIDHPLGSGGMADVYCATDLQLGRTVALKLLYSRFAQDEEFVERFRREASSAAGLQHQHIVSVYDRGEWDGTYYIAMEHLTGRTLKAVIMDRGPLAPHEAIDLTIQILRAARFAHRRGVVHRDFKPHNVIVDDEGRATVTDFGIARAGASEMTQTGSIMGTAQYLSPEQAQGHAVSASSDLYSIGVVLYEMLAGRVPFEGESAVTIALKQVTEEPLPPSVLNPAVPPALEAVVLRALMKDPAARYASADEFIAALEAVRDGVAVAPPTQATQIAAAPTTVLPPAAAASYARPPAPVEPYEEDPARRWWLPVLIALLVIGALVAGLLIGRTKQVTVPTVVGLSQSAATVRLQDKGFKVGIRPQTGSAPQGQVTAQDPGARAKADKGSVVTLTVSAGAGDVAIPVLDNAQGADAHRRLVLLSFRVRDRRTASDAIAKDVVVRTSPPAGSRLAKGSLVTLFISSGKQQATVPQLTGLSLADATSALSAAGLTPSTTEKNDPKVDSGTVLSQAPPQGTKVDKGSSVAIVVSKRPANAKLPNTVGQDQAAAIEALSGAGFQVSPSTQDTSDQTQDGVVLAQDPARGKASPGSTVAIVVGRYVDSGTTAAAGSDPGGTPGGTP